MIPNKKYPVNSHYSPAFKAANAGRSLQYFRRVVESLFPQPEYAVVRDYYEFIAQRKARYRSHGFDTTSARASAVMDGLEALLRPW